MTDQEFHSHVYNQHRWGQVATTEELRRIHAADHNPATPDFKGHTHETLTAPLPAHHHRLRNGRYEVNIARPGTKRAGSWVVHATGRFDLHSLDAALQWAAANTPDGHRVTVTSYSARDGWTPHRVPLPEVQR